MQTTYGKSNDNVPRGELGFARKIAAEGARAQRENARFEKLSDAEKRVAIAEDVIKQLNMRILFAERGTYGELRREDNENWDTRRKVKITDTGTPQCNVCAIGAMFACITNTTRADKAGSWTMRDKLGAWFSESQLDEIESAFEGYPTGAGTWAAAMFNDGVENDSFRMRRIMRNIIRNDGEFKP